MKEQKPSEDRSDPRELLDLDVREVSLVDRPAIRRKFLIIKRDEDGENTMSDDQEVVAKEATAKAHEQEAFTFDEVPCSDEEVAKTEVQPEEAIEASAQEETLEKSEEEVAEVQAAKAAEAPKEEKEEKEEEEEEEEESEKKAAKSKTSSTLSKRDDGTYNLEGVPENVQEAIENICKQHDAAIEKAERLEEVLKAERGERLRRDFIEKADKEYTNLPGTSEDLGVLIKSLHDLDEAVAQKIEGIFKTVNAQLESGAILEEVGTPAVEAETTAWGRIEKQASELVSTGDSNSQAAAISKVLEMNPQLYQDYLKEGGN